MNNNQQEVTNELLYQIFLQLQDVNDNINDLEYQIKSYKKNLDDRVSRIVKDWRTKEEVERAVCERPKTYENRKYFKAYDDTPQEKEDEINNIIFEERITN